jgi:hypothetical protein
LDTGKEVDGLAYIGDFQDERRKAPGKKYTDQAMGVANEA